MTVETLDSTEMQEVFPGSVLQQERELKGYSREYVAGRLHLRVRIIELLEEDQYNELPEPVFVKGYIRAYAKLIELDHNPLLMLYNTQVKGDMKQDRTLWQAQREVNTGIHVVRWLTLLSFIVVVIAVGTWWHKSKDSLDLSKAATSSLEPKQIKKVTLTDLNKMQTVVELPTKAKKPS
jgi:cytoskeleton protein RodZ